MTARVGTLLTDARPRPGELRRFLQLAAHTAARGVPEADRGGDQQVSLDGGLRCAVACSPSSTEVGVVWSFLYLAVRRVLELIVLCFRSAEANEIEILVLRQGLRCCAASIHGPAWSPPTGRCLRR